MAKCELGASIVHLYYLVTSMVGFQPLNINMNGFHSVTASSNRGEKLKHKI